jgi:hypothetical protein
VDRPDMVRGVQNLKRLSITDLKLDVPRLVKKKELAKAFEGAQLLYIVARQGGRRMQRHTVTATCRACRSLATLWPLHPYGCAMVQQQPSTALCVEHCTVCLSWTSCADTGRRSTWTRSCAPC